MSEMQSALKMLNGKMGCNVIRYPSGRFGFVGSVPVLLAYVDGATEDQIRKAAQFGGRFGPKTRMFETEQEAREFAAQHNVTLCN